MSGRSGAADHDGWALVTGGGSGIGRALCRGLHRRGHKLFVTSLNEEELASLRDDLAGGPEVRTLALDLTADGAVDRAWDAARALDAPVDVLINCAGFGLFGEHLALDDARVEAMLRLNILALTALTTRCARSMIPRRQGRILNVASTAAFQPLPHLAAYAASKSFVASFTAALSEELAPHGVRVSLFCPGATRTPFLATAGLAAGSGEGPVSRAAHAVAMDPDDVAERALSGLFAGERRIVPGALNVGHLLLTRLVPDRVITRVFDAFGSRGA